LTQQHDALRDLAWLKAWLCARSRVIAHELHRVMGPILPEMLATRNDIVCGVLSSPKMARSVRKALEAKILAGEPVTAPQIRKARGRLKGGCLKRKPDQPAPRMAA
jgi:hypothetical protein